MRYYCHQCHTEVEGSSPPNDSDEEPACSSCGSNFVELVGQDVQSFLSPPISSSSSSSSSSASSSLSSSSSSSSSARRTASRLHSSRREGTSDRRIGISSFQTSPVMMMRFGDSTGNEGGPPLSDILNLLFRGSDGMGGGPGSEESSGLDHILHQLFMNEEGTPATPTSPEAMAALKRERDGDELQKLGECGITLEPFTEGDVAVIMPCEHAFKEEAILQWLQTHDTCPVCRKAISENH